MKQWLEARKNFLRLIFKVSNIVNFKKITIAAGIFPPDIGGPATYVKRLAKALSEMGWQVRVVCYSNIEQRTLNNEQYKFKVFRILRRGNVLGRYWRYLWRLVSVSKNADVIYAQGPISAGLPAMIAAKMLRKKFIIKVVGDPVWEQVVSSGLTSDMIEEFQKKKYGGKIRLLKNIRSFVCQQADKIITPSGYLKKIVMGWGVDENKIALIYNAVDSQNTKHETHNMTQGRHEGDIILSAGRLVKWKGFGALIEIMPELLRENPKFRLVILGDGPEELSLKSKVKSQKLGEAVELLGKVSHNEVVRHLQISMVFVLNTGYEGLPHTVLEAMQAGCPVVTTNVGGNPEVVQDGRNALLVEYNNKGQLKKAILRLYRDGGLREKLIEQAKRDLEKFNFENMISKTEEVISEVIG